MTASRRLSSLLAAASLLLGTAACAGTDQSARPRTDRTLAPPPGYVASSTPEPVAAASVPSLDARSGDRRVVSGAGLAFEVPQEYEQISSLLAGLGARVTDVQQAAARLGVSAEQLQAAISGSALLVADTSHPGAAFADNVNVIVLPGVQQLPAPAELRDQLALQSMTVDRLRHLRTGAGPATTVTYTIPFRDRRLAGTAVLVDLGDTVVDVTVTALERATTDAVAERVLATLTRS